MNNELTKLIREEIDRRYESTKEISDKLRKLQRVYDALIPNKNKKEVISVGNLTEDLFYEFVELIHQYNNILYIELVKLTTRTYNFSKNTDYKENSNIDNSVFANAGRRYNQMQNGLKEHAEKVNKVRAFFAYAVTYIVELYEKLYDEKEIRKEERKILESSLKTLTKNRTLSSKEIKSITELIESSDVDKNEYYDLLNKHIKQKKESYTNKKEEQVIETSDEVVQTTYLDKEPLTLLVTKEKNIEESLITNYITTIYSLQNDEQCLKEFLDGISYNEDFEEILNKILIIISENGDVKLANYLLNYQKSLFKQEISEDDSNDITLLYYGFLNDKEKILSDIEKNTSVEDYKDILKALYQIKNDGAVNNRRNIVRIRKVFKLRVNNIRVTFKRISKNVYIVLGIYTKKDNHGAAIIHSTERRNNHLLWNESQLINAIKLNELWDLYLQKNIEMEENIFGLLKEHIYTS